MSPFPNQAQGSKQKTFIEGLSGIAGQIGQLMVTPDADHGFCQALLGAIAKKVQQGAPQALGPPGAPGPQMMGPTPNGVRRELGGIPPQAAQAAFGSGGAPEGGAASTPNVDELRRTIGAAQGL